MLLPSQASSHLRTQCFAYEFLLCINKLCSCIAHSGGRRPGNVLYSTASMRARSSLCLAHLAKPLLLRLLGNPLAEILATLLRYLAAFSSCRSPASSSSAAPIVHFYLVNFNTQNHNFWVTAQNIFYNH